MSEENVYKQKFEIAQWPTSKVTLYPTQAMIFRQIHGVQLKPGLNEITISDLTSHADADSIRVSGTTDGHPARINDMTIDLIPNKYAYLSTSFDSESDSEDEEQDDDPQSLITAREECERIFTERKKVEERKSLAGSELSYLQQYTNSMSTVTSGQVDPATMKSAVDLYATQSKAHFETVTECAALLDKLTKEGSKAQKVLEKELKKLKLATRAKLAAKERKKIEREERQREKKENKPEKMSEVYRVRIMIDLPGGPESNNAEAREVFSEASLNLTYTTSSASWTPHYDLRLDTTNPPLSTLTYRAHFVNRTSETWTNAHITLSTSQASFGGLNEKIPQMKSWRVTLQNKHHFPGQTGTGENGLYSAAEIQAKQEPQKLQIPIDLQTVLERGERLQSLSHNAAYLSDQSKQFKSVTRSSGGRGAGARLPQLGASLSTTSWYRNAVPPGAPASGGSDGEGAVEYAKDADGATLAPSDNLIAHSTAGLDTYGFTTTYELPTPRTIPSSPLVRRHVIAEVSLPSLIFTHILIPKLKSAAFLKAKLVNTSNVPLLPGQAGLTLDGSFLGKLTFPRASPEETVVLELGVDQGIKVEYEQPTTKHGTQGMIGFGKEEVGTYKRMMRLTNSKGASVSLVVLDQIPVPDDERLKVTILAPKGLKTENDTVKQGVGVDGKMASSGKKRQNSVGQSTNSTLPVVPEKLELEGIPENMASRVSIRGSSFFSKRDSSVASSSKSNTDSPTPPTVSTPSTSSWGKAKASLRKNGEVRWDVDLVKGGCVALGLEWECRMPNGELILALS